MIFKSFPKFVENKFGTAKLQLCQFANPQVVNDVTRVFFLPRTSSYLRVSTTGFLCLLQFTNNEVSLFRRSFHSKVFNFFVFFFLLQRVTYRLECIREFELVKRSEMTIFESLLTTFEVNNLF